MVLPSDPLFQYQWHLRNTTIGEYDLNVVKVWDDYTGNGVLVGVIDDGFDYLHDDLNNNYRWDIDYDYNNNDYDPYGNYNNSHGTSVAGVIAAERNGIGGVGVAYGANITGFRAIAGDISNVQTAVTNALWNSVNLDVVNNSWGFSPQGPVYNGFYDNFNNPAFFSAKQAIENAVQNGRGGLGTAIVFAAGNHRAVGENTNYHNFQNSRHAITVGALNADGNVSSYSTPGASILVSAFGSEGNIVTTDRTGSAGENTNGWYYDGSNLQYGDPDYNYTFNGTSAAAPMVSGVVALMLEANPDLGYRDIQEILAYSARATGNNTTYNFNEANNWNGGGLHFSHDAGFGLVDAHAAVRLAETWENQSTYANEQEVSSGFLSTNAVIPDYNPYNPLVLNSQINMAAGLEIDFVEVELDIDHSWRGDLLVTLTSPDGTTSELINRPGTNSNNIVGDSGNNIKFTVSSTHFWGEDSGGENGTGDWTLSVQDLHGLTFSDVDADGYWDNGVGVLNSWKLNLYGDTNTANDTYIYTNEFSSISDPSRQILTDDSGIDTINASAITSDTNLDLTPGAVSTLAGKSLTISTNTTVENAFTGDGDDEIIGNSADNNLNGGRGDDTLDGGAGGIDTLVGGVGNDLYIVSSGATYYPTIIESANEGIDAVESYFNYTLGNNLENLTLTGTNNTNGTGNSLNNSITGNSGNNLLEGKNGNDLIYGGVGNDTLDGGSGDDTLLGEAGVDSLIGGSGNDILDGGTGADILIGGLGNETYIVDNASDIIIENLGEGVETVEASVTYALDSANALNHLTLTGTGNINGTGNGNANDIIGNTGNNQLMGGNGNDTLLGGGGNDTLNGENGNDVLNGFGGGVEFDTLTGGAGTDTFVLGDSFGAFYAAYQGANWGYSDYATITDFNLQDDIIKVTGSASEYSLYTVNWFGDQPTSDTAIFYGSDLIAITQDTSNLNFNQHFTFV